MGPENQGNGRPNASASGESNGGRKGKGVTRDELESEQTDGDSIASRVGNSAAGLARSIFHGAPSTHDLASVSSSDKTGASSSSSRPDARARVETSSTAAAAPSSSGTASFRSGQTEAHIAAEEAAFSHFLDSTSVFGPTENASMDNTRLEKAWNVASSTSMRPVTHGTARENVGPSVDEQQQSDGAEVVRLLSQMEEEVPAYEDHMMLSEKELKSLRRALFEDGSPDQVSASDWNNMLNFIPDFLRGEDGSASESGWMSLGLTDTAEASQLWLEEWNRVLTSYNDEVWGDLGDLVQQARTEIQTMTDSQQGQKPDPAALRHLRTVLTRVRARL